MKRALAILVCFVMLFALIGCAAETQQPEQSQAAVDMLGHRLVPVKRMDLK